MSNRFDYAGLVSARLKLERANHHIADVERQWKSLVQGHRIGVFIRDNPITGHRGIFVESDETSARHIGCLAGDAIHNLHSALDHIIWDLVSVHNPPTPERVQFPFSKSKDGLVGVIANRQIKLAGPEVVKAIDEIEPYPGGKGDDLFRLHEVDNFEKHRVISPVTAALSINWLNLQALDPAAPPVQFEGMTWIGGPIVTWPAPKFANRQERRAKRVAKDGQKIDASVDVFFEQSMPFPNKPIIPTLVSVSKKVSEIIKRFEEIP